MLRIGHPIEPNLTPGEAKLLQFARGQAMTWREKWRFTGLYPETHRDRDTSIRPRRRRARAVR